MVLAAVVVLIAAGAVAYRNLNVEAYPNPVPPMIEVLVQPSGLGPEEVEKYVTVPLEVGLAGMPGLDHVRSQSLFGLGDVKCYFKWGTDYAAARQEVINRLSRKDGIGGSDIEKIFNCPVFASVPNDYFPLHRVISLGQPLSPDCELGRAIAGLAAKVSASAPNEKNSPSPMAEPRPALSQT